ncbi:uracil-DNA glycosylase family protein [Fictibacillus iocasae]|uniref:Uracil-DNA glycosylase family protein n=1 Tax=Fictibacillus iocasae TaxID=2715437 RepID=A0ABW2NN57_9BACL
MLQMQDLFLEAKHRYSVHDLYKDPPALLFVLESPHKEELKHGVPVAGSSGRSMTKFLLNENVPFGLRLKEHPSLLEKMGIVNVCPFPMQRSAINDEEWKQNNSSFLEHVEKIRTSASISFKDKERAVLHNILLQDFKERLKTAASNETTIVPCGKFAGRYVSLANKEQTYSVLEGVPHPSYNSWGRERYQEVLMQVKKLLK